MVADDVRARNIKVREGRDTAKRSDFAGLVDSNTRLLPAPD
jgi:hypothetical protein